jgi:replication factor A1
VKLVLWGQRAIEFDAELMFDNGQNTPVVGVFVGVLMKSYNSELFFWLSVFALC